MREHSLPKPPDTRRVMPPDWLADLRTILFDGSGPAEGRLEAFLDRLERRP
ncbi:MAG: hypothetical protein MUF63_06435 [Rhodobacteraceae bacterium]|jgi:hypothetical protein|nr:hypothetical protein [Paracoccaceae bacterium]